MDNTIQVTTRYDRFKFMENNRATVPGHIDRLKKAFTENGNFTKVQPILVNERLEIIDGQHRFVASKELGEPIYYTIVPGLTVNDARQMNIMHRGWSIEDYARSYAASGDENYIRYLSIYDDYNYGHSVVMAYAQNMTGKGYFTQFRAGELEMDEIAEVETRERLDKLDEVAEVAGAVAQNRAFALALLKVMNTPGFDFKRLLKKLKYAGDLRTFVTLTDNLRQLEEIYNYNQTEGTRLRLY